MREEKRLLNLLGEVDEKYIAEAAPGKKKQKKLSWVKWAGLAACICAALLGIIGKSIFTPSRPEIKDGEVYYGDLQLPNGNTDSHIIREINKESGKTSGDIISFDESRLLVCSAVLEGKITNMYIKNYSYVVSYQMGSYEKKQTEATKTIVYEMQVENVWYGDNAVGDTVLIQDEIYFSDQTFYLKKGHSYVIPIYEVGNTVYHVHGGVVLSGYTTRDSVYCTAYPYHPQIEATLDNNYIVTTDWATFAAAKGSKIIMDEDDFYKNNRYYKDKIKLLSGETFNECMNKIISSMTQDQ